MKLSYESFAYKLVIKKPVLNKRKVVTAEMKTTTTTTTTTRIRISRKSSKEVTQQQREHMRRNKPREKKLQDSCVTMSSLLAIVVLAFLLTCPPTTNNLSKLIEAAVVRPTIFKSDTNSPETAQQPQPQPPHQLQLPHQIPNSQVNPLSDGPQTPNTKINPLKSQFCTNKNGARLDSPVGLQSFAVDDLALSASSYSNEQVRPHMARLNLDLSGGAWCPIKPISGSNFGKEWIQVKLNRSFVITAIETQGRFGMGSGKEYVPSYQIEYSRNGGLSWHKWKDIRGSNLLRANEDVNTAVRNELSPPIVGANVVRILPYSQHLRTVCLRFELHGCHYDEGAPIAYSTNDGVVEPRWGHLIDHTYDGLRIRGLLSQGLGQLVDGVKGHDNFSFNNGFEWVGWKSMNGDVVIEFTFKTVRNFTAALFHSNNLFSSGVEVFQAVDVQYGIDVPTSLESLKDTLLEERRRDAISRTQKTFSNEEQQQQPEIIHNQQQQQHTTLWSPDILSLEYEPDKKFESSRQVTVHLKQRLANKLRFVLKFASKWILVSEVEFLSHPVELLSLSSLSDQHTLPLMQALNPAKSYDEYIAILREHQLRRIAQNDYLKSFNSNSSSPSSSSSSPSSPNLNGINLGSTTSTDGLSDRPYLDGSSTSSTSVYDDPLNESNKPDQDDSGRIVNGPAIPSSSNDMIWHPNQNQNQNQNPTQIINNEIVAGPSTNPMLNSNQLMPMFPPISRSPPSSEPFGGSSNQIDLSSLTNGLKPQQPDYLSQNPNNMFGVTSEKRSIGVATVISFVLVSILVLLGLLFAISSYRLRHQPKLGPPPSIGQARHLVNGSGSTTTTTGKSGLVNPSLQSFMNVFSSSPPSTLPVGATAAAAAATNQLDSHYNAIFATNERSRNNTINDSNNANNSMKATLKKLATLTGSSSSRKLKNKQKHNQTNNLLFNHQPSNQLLVSVKESSGNQLFGNQTTSGKGQAINTQLIVGFNQANPLAQQQIYNNSSNLNCSNQTYATHYSTSMSMASSSTNGHQGDYDYAIPDAQPIIPSSQHQQQHSQHLHQSTMSPLVSIHHHHQQHLNHAFNSNTNNFRYPTSTLNNTTNNNFNYQTEMRASHRGGGHLGHQTTLVQQAMQQPLRPTEHNYELINQDQAQHQASNLRPSLPNPHHRTLSNQLMTCQSQQQSQQAPFSATTLNTPRLINNNEQVKRILPQVVTAEEASPGGNSSQSVSTTTTSASGNNSMDIQGSHYYYSANEQQQQQLKSGAQNNKQQRLNR